MTYSLPESWDDSDQNSQCRCYSMNGIYQGHPCGFHHPLHRCCIGTITSHDKGIDGTQEHYNNSILVLWFVPTG